MTEELKKIQEQFNEVIAYSQTGISDPQTDELFKDWLEAKRDIIEAFDGKLIVEYPTPITFTLTEEERQQRVHDFCQMASRMSSVALANFIQSNSEGFFNNQVMLQYDSDAFKIPKGMKLVKAFKFFEPDPEVLNKLQSAASMLIQENCVTGKLCLSVHPLDFLSASENNHNWRSCHSLDGDYRSGNLSYMVDSSTFMCYIKTKDDEYLPNFPDTVPWNSKKWRVFLYLSDDWKVLFAGRQYPFRSFEAMEFIRDEVLPKYNIGWYQKWIESSIHVVKNRLNDEVLRTRYPYIIVGGYLRPIHQVVVNRPGSLQFNDVLSSSSYEPMYAHAEEESAFEMPAGFTAKSDTTVYVGGKVKCLRCGSEDIELSGTMMCTNCELAFGDCVDDSIEICPCCGERYLYDDGVYVESLDSVICPDCADNSCTRCEVCGNLYPNNDLIYDELRERYICVSCNDWELEERLMNAEYEKERL